MIDAPPDTRILVVDDDANQRSLLESFLTQQGFTVLAAPSGERALDILSSQPVSMMISDVRMPGISGLDALRRARQADSRLPVLLVTAYADIRGAVEAVRGGAVDYLEKPIDLDELLTLVRGAVGLGTDAARANVPGQALPSGVTANSTLIRETFREAALASSSDTRVLITGESGSGKGVVAEMVHRWSPRCGGPFVRVDCAAIPQEHLESKMFGLATHSGASADSIHPGAFEEANGGTILLDEAADIQPALQAKLLRVVQDGVFHIENSNSERRTDVRTIVSTSKNLEEEVSKGTFREDLFYRLNVMEIYVPPLREREADIVPLAELFAAQFSRNRPRLSPSAVACLEGYAWPGNVRELRNAIERATLLSGSQLILPAHLPKRMQENGPEAVTGAAEGSSSRKMEDIERTAILSALREHKYNRSETARVLGISRRALLYKLRRFKEQGYAVDPEPVS